MMPPKIFRAGNAPGTGPGTERGRARGAMPAMEPYPAPIASLTRHLAVRSATTEGRQAVARWAAAGLAVDGCRTPLDVATSCHDPAGRQRAELLVADLIDRAPTDELAGLTALVALRPALVRVARRLARGPGSADVEAVLVAAAWSAVGQLAAAPPAHDAARRVVAAVWTAGLADRRRHRRRHPVNHLPEGWDRPAPDSDPADLASTLLDDARARAVVNDRQAALVHDSRMLERPLAELAREAAVRVETLRRERSRAERRLRAFVDAGAR